jgi:hypothetical protein
MAGDSFEEIPINIHEEASDAVSSTDSKIAASSAPNAKHENDVISATCDPAVPAPGTNEGTAGVMTLDPQQQALFQTALFAEMVQKNPALLSVALNPQTISVSDTGAGGTLPAGFAPPQGTQPGAPMMGFNPFLLGNPNLLNGVRNTQNQEGQNQQQPSQQQHQPTASEASGAPFGGPALTGFNPLVFGNPVPLNRDKNTQNQEGQNQQQQGQSQQQQAIVNEAYQRGRDEAFLSMMNQASSAAAAAMAFQGGGLLPNNLGQVPFMPMAGNFPPQAFMANSGDANDQALAALGSTTLDRRTQNAPYFDASMLADPDPVAISNRRTRGGVTEPFPEKLYRMIQDAEQNGNSDVISFFPHGRAFIVRDPDRFVTEIMPKYFKQGKMSSFLRQLNLYGFQRINNGPDTGGYYHELFLKGRPAICIHIKRVGVPQAEPRRRGVKAHESITTPDFYSMNNIQPSSHPTGRSSGDKVG